MIKPREATAERRANDWINSDTGRETLAAELTLLALELLP